jgi:drug/metabolite transporter (DMT)-like permease
MPILSHHFQAVLWMCGTLISLSLMGLAARELSVVYDTGQILLARNAVGFLVVLIIMLRQGVGIARTRRVGMHALRNFVHIVGVASWFYGISLLPLAEVFVLESTLPIWVVLLAVPFLGEQLTKARVAAAVLGFLGILIILRPGLAIIDPAALIVLVGALGFASANIATKALTRTDGPLTILFLDVFTAVGGERRICSADYVCAAAGNVALDRGGRSDGNCGALLYGAQLDPCGCGSCDSLALFAGAADRLARMAAL